MRALLIVAMFVLPLNQALADANAGEKKAQLCLLCHKPSRVAVPLLEAQPEGYLVAATTGFKTGERTDSAMQMRPNVASLSPREISDIASYLASRPPITGAYPFDAEKAAAGQKRVQDLNCARCHGVSFSGGDLVPRLASQSPDYLVRQFEAFAASRRTHPRTVMPTDNQAELEAVAHYLTSLK